MPLAPVFTLNLNQKVKVGLLTIGKFDGVHPCLAGATQAGKVFIHNPHRGGARGGRLELTEASDISLLNINQNVTAIAAGRLDPSRANDVLVVGTRTNLLAYDIHRNQDLFYKESPDGCNKIVIGRLGNYNDPLAIVGGNCSIYGYDAKGNDPFWTVTGDNVSSLALMDFTDSKRNQLVVGSEDFDIRVFNEDEITSEITETEAITSLCCMRDGRFGYALSNGTVGVYEKTTRTWRIKSKNQAVCLASYDLDSDGAPELITGWSNGKIDARSDRTGEVIFKDNFTSSLAGVVVGDYRQDDRDQLLSCSVDGEVRGYQAAPPELRGNLMETNVEQDTIRDLSQRKQNLLMEMKNYEEISRTSLSPTAAMAAAQAASNSGANSTGGFSGSLVAGVTSELTDLSALGIIPANTQLQTSLGINLGSASEPPHVELQVRTTNDTIIRAVLLFAEAIFDGESHVVHPSQQNLSNTVRVPLYPPKDVPLDIHMKAFVGWKNSSQYHVFELMRPLVRFSMYSLCDPATATQIPSSLTFHINERVNRVVMWINQNFLLDNEVTCEGNLKLAFFSLRPSCGHLVIEMETSGQMIIRTDNMDLAGDIVQALCTFLNIDDLQVTADFPIEMEKLAVLLKQVDDIQAVRQKLSADLADHSNLIRGMVVKAEDARLMGEMKGMRRGYMELYDLNRDLINKYTIRCSNHQELLSCLKQVNQLIQRAGRLRVGKYKTQVINACRDAIKSNTISALYKIMRTGAS